MRQFDFATNIEHRMPETGKVYMIDRMTSDWAERHPLNVDQFIEDVYQEFAGTEFEEGREALRKMWAATLSMPVQGDASLYPNKNGAHRPAAMKVWHEAGDYWRRGFRIGDVLPERCPSCKITRLENGWIALFPKDMQLLDKDNCDKSPKLDLNLNAMNDVAVEALEEFAVETAEQTDVSVLTTVEHAGDSLSREIKDITEGTVPVCSPKTERERNADQRRRRREQREAQCRSYEERLEREAREAEEYARQQERRKIFAAVGAAAVTLAMIYFFGLLGPAVFGLLAGGLLKG